MTDPNPILPSMRLDGMVAAVTGAGRGIGRGCALAMAEAGAEVIAMSRTAAEIEEVAKIIRAKGGTARAVVCDVADTASIRQAFDGLERLDVLVNNAGVSFPEPFTDLTEDAVNQAVDINVRGATMAAHMAAGIMARQGSGVIVNMSSTFGKVGRPGTSVYSATKHYIEGLTKSAAVELAPKGIRVVAVGPTATDTPMTHDRLMDPVRGGDLLSRIPMGRFAQVQDVVGAVVFLASPAAALITGTTLMVDGGWTAQ